MNFVWIALLLPAQDPPPTPVPPAPPPPAVEPAPAPAPPQDPPSLFFVTPRVGVWWTGSFEAQTVNGVRKIERDLLWDLGFDVGRSWEPWQVAVSFDFAGTTDIQAFVGGIHVGKRFLIEELDDSPIEAVWTIGLIAGNYTVNVSDFGDFKTGVGFQSRLAVKAMTVAGSVVEVWVDVRSIPFEYEDRVTDGDDSAVNVSVAGGLSIVLKL